MVIFLTFGAELNHYKIMEKTSGKYSLGENGTQEQAWA